MAKDSYGIDFDKLSISGKVVRLSSLDMFDRAAALEIESQIESSIEGIEAAYRVHQDDAQRGRDYAGLYQEVSAAERVEWPGAYKPDILTERARYELLGTDYTNYVVGAQDRYDAYREGVARSQGVSVEELNDAQNETARKVAGIIEVAPSARKLPDFDFTDDGMDDRAFGE